MSGITQVGQAGPASAAALQTQYQVAVAKKQQEVAVDTGAAAIQLIQAALNGAAATLDVRA